MTHSFKLGGHTVWYHDEGHPAGFFHTFDDLQAAGSSDNPRRVHVLLPRDYETSGLTYPVLYMNDGQTAFFESDRASSWKVAERLDEAYREGVPELIVVAVHYINRDYEYTHAPPPAPGFIASGGLEGYSRYLAYPLKGFIDRHYRTIPGAEYTTILGSSHGGLAAFVAGISHAQRFGNIVAMSPSFWLPDTIELVRGIMKEAKQRPKRIWLDWGTRRGLEPHNAIIERAATASTKRMSALLQREFGYKHGHDLWTHEDPDAGHDEEAWSRRLPLALVRLLS